MPLVGRVVIAAAGLVVLITAAFAATRFGEASPTVLDATKEMATWAASGSLPGPETVGWLRDDLKAAAAKDSQDPTIQEMLGRLALIRSGSPGDPREAIERLEKAVHQRPTSPYSWSGLAQALYRVGDTGPKFQVALQRAAALGPWEPEVQRTVADLGLAAWEASPPETRSAVERMVANGMAVYPAETLQISGRRGRLQVACDHLPESKRTDPRWNQLCQGTEAPK